jgi:hypothetical protein
MLYFYEVSSRKEIFVLSHFSKLEGHLGFSADVQMKVIAEKVGWQSSKRELCQLE